METLLMLLKREYEGLVSKFRRGKMGESNWAMSINGQRETSDMISYFLDCCTCIADTLS